jgi:hypothetical protein
MREIVDTGTPDTSASAFIVNCRADLARVSTPEASTMTPRLHLINAYMQQIASERWPSLIDLVRWPGLGGMPDQAEEAVRLLRDQIDAVRLARSLERVPATTRGRVERMMERADG